MDFGTRLKELRKSKKLTQQELGNIVHVSKVSISGYERGERSPDRETLTALADFFGVTTDYLLGRNKTPDWAKKEDVIQLDKILKSNSGMSYGDDLATEKDREVIDDLIAGYFWSKKQKEKNKEG
ncbi:MULTISPECIES: helix-turn-helix transcriptional regulator [unclassified Enterococcus]|uniref:helix-turn-helix domain-containing protein n=1 Tax=unclassified Enterococcus TaxID=2608891 RepID=UPI0028FD7231|nr:MULTISPECIES: helix-turn-helix transcriptional regulator [unclassified Enterococcus]MDU0319000.1 helix-turn-helix transcriptional regulator [Enterococcus sp. 2STP]MDU0334488.1 helix-turn-helix transcriptional regulator [Enterococcus sp. 2CBP]MDU0350259.1 helix-turn-helix transcriptional regulator [Enterococcus sp. 3MOLP]